MASPLLVGDVGGTTIRLALVTATGAVPAVLRETRLPSACYTALEEPVLQFLGGAPIRPSRAVFAVAGPVVAGRSALTNLGWSLDQERLRESLGLSSVLLVNDVVAMAYAIPVLEPDALVTLQAGQPEPAGTRALVAPGTGLGHAFLTWEGAGFRAHPSEAGHGDFAPADELQDGLLEHLRARHGHVSFERVCSGRALPDLYAYLRGRGDVAARPGVAEQIDGTGDPTPVIIAAGLDGSDPCPLCRAALDLFGAILAAESGNVALRLLATGGVYLGGGLPRRVLPLLTGPDFLEVFRRKGRLSPLLARIPLHVIVKRHVGMVGTLQLALRSDAGGAAGSVQTPKG